MHVLLFADIRILKVDCWTGLYCYTQIIFGGIKNVSVCLKGMFLGPIYFEYAVAVLHLSSQEVGITVTVKLVSATEQSH